MPPNEICPNCQQLIEDWHTEWYKTEVPALYKGSLALDAHCAVSRQGIGKE
jgi:hypothetical protein